MHSCWNSVQIRFPGSRESTTTVQIQKPVSIGRLWIDSLHPDSLGMCVPSCDMQAGPLFFFHRRRTAEMFLQESQRLRCLYSPQAFGSFFDRLDAFNDALVDGFDRSCFLSCFDWSFVANNYPLAHANRRDGSQDLTPYPAGWWA